MADWGTGNTSPNAPLFLNNQYANSYSNTYAATVAAVTNRGIVSINAAQAATIGGGVVPGWVHVRKGSGPVIGLTITSGGATYTNADTWTKAPNIAGGVAATGTLVTTAGAITGFTITNPGSGHTGPGAITITTTAGTGANITTQVGGKGGRVFYETLVSTASQQ